MKNIQHSQFTTTAKQMTLIFIYFFTITIVTISITIINKKLPLTAYASYFKLIKNRPCDQFTAVTKQLTYDTVLFGENQKHIVDVNCWIDFTILHLSAI